jgi:hypothetical protein
VAAKWQEETLERVEGLSPWGSLYREGGHGGFALVRPISIRWLRQEGSLGGLVGCDRVPWDLDKREKDAHVDEFYFENVCELHRG